MIDYSSFFGIFHICLDLEKNNAEIVCKIQVFVEIEHKKERPNMQTKSHGSQIF